MKKRSVCCFVLLIVMLMSSCSPGPAAPASKTPEPTATAVHIPTATSTAAPTAKPSPTPVPLPAITLGQGDFYFSVEGKQSFLFSRNVAGYSQAHYKTFIGWAESGGGSFVRVQLNAISMGYTGTGKVDEAWAAEWDKVFDAARSEGIYVLPVFSSWFDWNAGNPYSDYSTWNQNKFNEALGGSAKSPAELFEKDSATRTAWLEWMKALALRWKGHDNILGWEIFSEVNLVTGATEPLGVELVNTAAGVIRSADPGRPVTASIADTGEWRKFYCDADIDFIQVHPYFDRLGRTIVQTVGDYRKEYNKPVLIGESGLNSESPAKYPGGAEAGVRHAVWAGIVSGAMNGRALYWEDSFALFFSGQGIPWMERYKTIELPAFEFVKGVDFAGFAPFETKTTKDVWGAAIGNESSLIGWYRDAGCEPPDYAMKPVLSGQSVTITVPGTAANWKVDFYNTKDGVTLLGSVTVARSGKTVAILLPDFSDDIAFKAHAG